MNDLDFMQATRTLQLTPKKLKELAKPNPNRSIGITCDRQLNTIRIYAKMKSDKIPCKLYSNTGTGYWIKTRKANTIQ